jgi:hypothetical protein
MVVSLFLTGKKYFMSFVMSYTENRKILHFCVYPLVSVNYCDFLTPTDAVTENPQKYLAAEKYY